MTYSNAQEKKIKNSELINRFSMNPTKKKNLACSKTPTKTTQLVIEASNFCHLCVFLCLLVFQLWLKETERATQKFWLITPQTQIFIPAIPGYHLLEMCTSLTLSWHCSWKTNFLFQTVPNTTYHPYHDIYMVKVFVHLLYLKCWRSI